jgi:hypothetical protein
MPHYSNTCHVINAYRQYPQLEFLSLLRIPDMDYKRRPAGVNALALWVNSLQSEPTLIPKFIPENCGTTVEDAVTFGAGVNFLTLFEYMRNFPTITI